MSLSCEDVRERLLDGPLDGGDGARAHLETCAACSAVAASLVEIDGALASLPERPADAALVARTLERATPASPEAPAEPAPIPAGRLAIAALVAALVALVQAPLALLRWLATPKRAGAALGLGALGAAAASLFLVTLADRSAEPQPASVALRPPPPPVAHREAQGGDGAEAPAAEIAENESDLPVSGTDVDRTVLAFAEDRSEPLDLVLDGRFAADESRITERERTLEQSVLVPSGSSSVTTTTTEVIDDWSDDDTRRGERTQHAQVVDRETRAQLDALGYALPAQEAEDVGGRDDAWLASLGEVESIATRPREGWWENTYVPGDPALRVLRRRLAAHAPALALAELASPAAPALAAPRDAAIALGVRADVRAVEGAQRARVEVALRGLERAAGRRDPLRVALVIDATRGLDTAAQARIRDVVAALGRARGARDRVALHVAGQGGGELVALGELRHGEVEVALRRAFAAEGGEVVPLGDALTRAIAAAGGGEGAGLVLLLTPDGALDAASESALHAGALAGVPTSALAIDGDASLAALDRIALAGHGRRRSVASAEDAEAAVRAELEAASRIVARALRIELRLAEGVELVDVVGSRPLDAERRARARAAEHAVDHELAQSLGITADRDDAGRGVVVYVPAFHAGASHALLLDVIVRGPGAVLDVDVRYKDLVRLRNGRATGALSLARGRPSRGPAELLVSARLVSAEVATGLDEAADHLARGDAAAARERIVVARARLESACAAIEGLARVPAIAAERALLEQALAALDTTPASILSASLRYASRRHVVVPASLER